LAGIAFWLLVDKRFMHAGHTGEPENLNMVCSVPTMCGEAGPENRVQSKRHTGQTAI